MIRPVVKDTFFLAQKSEPAGKEDMKDIQDLLDTFRANREKCVGMAANMIGVKKRFIVVEFMGVPLIMINPKITSKKGAYTATEGCLSLTGMRKTERFDRITVAYQDMQFRPHTQSFAGLIAQIIQHEIDHCDGIII